MKRMLPTALLLLCTIIIMSGFSILPVRYSKTKTQSPTAFSWPITGTTGSSVGTVNYSISGSDIYPSYITFTSGSTSYGPYFFVQNSSTEYTATGMKSSLNITAVVFDIANGGTNYNVEIISPY